MTLIIGLLRGLLGGFFKKFLGKFIGKLFKKLLKSSIFKALKKGLVKVVSTLIKRVLFPILSIFKADNLKTKISNKIPNLINTKSNLVKEKGDLISENNDDLKTSTANTPAFAKAIRIKARQNKRSLLRGPDKTPTEPETLEDSHKDITNLVTSKDNNTPEIISGPLFQNIVAEHLLKQSKADQSEKESDAKIEKVDSEIEKESEGRKQDELGDEKKASDKKKDAIMAALKMGSSLALPGLLSLDDDNELTMSDSVESLKDEDMFGSEVPESAENQDTSVLETMLGTINDVDTYIPGLSLLLDKKNSTVSGLVGNTLGSLFNFTDSKNAENLNRGLSSKVENTKTTIKHQNLLSPNLEASSPTFNRDIRPLTDIKPMGIRTLPNLEPSKLEDNVVTSESKEPANVNTQSSNSNYNINYNVTPQVKVQKSFNRDIPDG